jgi:hypothetical protein
MAGTIVTLDSVAAISADTTTKLPGGRGAHAAATYYFDATTVTGAWTLTLSWKPSGTSISTAVSASFSAAGLQILTNQAPFTGVNRAMPAPDTILYDNTSAGALTGTLIAIYGD